jgi:hypothetical protein
MNAATNQTRSTYKGLASILDTVYGVAVLSADPTTILWAAERLMKSEGMETALRELSALNRRRNQAGKIPAYPAYGTKLFEAWLNPSKGVN